MPQSRNWRAHLEDWERKAIECFDREIADLEHRRAVVSGKRNKMVDRASARARHADRLVERRHRERAAQQVRTEFYRRVMT